MFKLILILTPSLEMFYLMYAIVCNYITQKHITLYCESIKEGGLGLPSEFKKFFLNYNSQKSLRLIL